MSDIRVTVTFARQVCDDTDPDISYLTDTAGNYKGLPAEDIAKYVAQDEARVAALHRGDWYMIGVRAVATIVVHRETYSTQYTLKSSGPWGIESDSGEEYLDEVFANECATLKADIEAMKTLEFVS